MGSASSSKPSTASTGQTRRLTLYALIGLSLAMCALALAAAVRHSAVSEATELAWSFVFVMLTILWAHCDARLRHFHEPFEFGFLAYLLWPLVFPWYLVSTHGARGLPIFLGFVLLWLLPWLTAALAVHFGG